MNRPLALALCLLVLPCAAQETHRDADNAGEAVGMMKSKVATAKAMLHEWSTRFPDAAAGFATDLDRVLAAEATNMSHFRDLSSSVWRERTPRAFKYLDDDR